MTEAQWLAHAMPEPMLEYLHDRVSGRKLRLFAVACCRRIQRLFAARLSGTLVELVELWADDPATDHLLIETLAQYESEIQAIDPLPPERDLNIVASSLALRSPWQSAWFTVSDVRRAIQSNLGGGMEAEGREQAALLREVFGNPFHPVVADPRWLTWNDRTVARLASRIDAERAFDRMAVLADALEEAGCADPLWLSHCRGPNRHVRGCWVVDAVLGKDR